MKTAYFSLVVVLILATPVARAATLSPGVLNYQGRIQAGGTDFTGTGQFKFEIRQNTRVWWRNAPDGNSDGEPDTAVSLSVDGGLFNVGLGNSALPNMAAMTFFDPVDGSSNTLIFGDVVLRVWFNDGVNGFQRLLPDQPLLSAPYARQAAAVDVGAITTNMLGSNAVTGAKIAAGTITTSDFAAGALSRLDAPDGSPASVLTVDNAGLIGVQAPSSTGLAAPSTALMTLGQATTRLRNIAPVGANSAAIETGEVFGSLTAALEGATDLALSGANVLVTSATSDSLSIINNTDPANPALIGMLQNGVGGVTSLDGVNAVAISGNFACLTSGVGDAFTIVNITNPAAPTVSSVRTDGAGGFNDLNAATDVVVSGNTAFVAASADDAVTIINIANKASPTVLATLKDGVGGVTTLNVASELILAGTTLYVRSAEGITSFNVSNPAAPTLRGSVAATSTATMALSGTNLYVFRISALQIYDVSGATPALSATLELRDLFPESQGGIPLFSVTSLAIDGTDLWAISDDGVLSPRLLVFDISSPTAPTLTHVASAAAPPGGFALSHFFVSPATLVPLGGGQVAAINASPGVFQNLAKSTSMRPGAAIVTEGSVGIGTSQPLVPLHVRGDGFFENGNLVVGDGGISTGANSALAVGRDNVVDASNSAAVGSDLRVRRTSELAVGFFNVSSSTTLFTVGNGGSTSRNNALTVLSNGNIGLNGVAAPANPLEHSSGARLTAGGTWTNASDRNLKENLAPADPRDVLDKVAELPLYTWNYKTEDAATPHLGPMAQDFHAAFGLGGDDRSISTVDASGVALAAIQALIEENKALRERLAELERRLGPPAPAAP